MLELRDSKHLRMGELVSALFMRLEKMARLEVDLLRAHVEEDVAHNQKRVLVFGLGTIVSLASVTLFAVSLVEFLRIVLAFPAWSAQLAVALFFAVVAVIMFSLGAKGRKGVGEQTRRQPEKTPASKPVPASCVSMNSEIQ